VDHSQRQQLGCGPLWITRLGFGAAAIGNKLEAVTDEDALSSMEAAWDAGIRYFDTAPWYGLGLSEHRVGAFLRTKLREEYVLSTKVGRLLKPWPPRFGPRVWRGPWVQPLDFEVRFDYSYGGIIRAYEDSLQRLGLPEVDILLVHDLERGIHVPETSYQARLGQLSNGGFDALRDLRADRKISAIGAGVNKPGVITDILDRFDVDLFLVAGPYALLEQTILDTELRRCEEAGVSVIIGAAFCEGLLIKGGLNRTVSGAIDAKTLERARKFEEACRGLGVPLAAAALQFPLAHPAVRSLVFGAVNAVQVEEVIEWFGREIPERLWELLKETELVPTSTPVPS
jgi:D-threo-aldose 1-dehydrogenase